MAVVAGLDGREIVAIGVACDIHRCGALPVLVVVSSRHLHVASCGFKVVAVVGVERHQLVGVFLRAIAVVQSQGGEVRGCRGGHIYCAFASGDVSAHGGMEFHVGEEMEFVVHVKAADDALHRGARVILVDQSAWVAHAAVDRNARGIQCLVVSAISGIVGVDGTAVVEAVLIISTLDVECELQMVLEKRGVENHVAGPSLGVVLAHESVLTVESCRHTEGQEPRSARKAQIVVGAEGGAIDLVVPVGIVVAKQSSLCSGALGVDGIDKLVAAHHVDHARTGLQAVGGAEIDAQLSFGTFFRGDDDDTIGSTRTIDGRGGSVFEYSHALDVVWVDQAQEVAAVARYAALLQGYAVEDDERVVAGVERGTATDADCGARGSRTAV